MHFYVVDTETSGLSSSHEITEISLIRCTNRVQLSKFIRIEHPERASMEALRATGRTMADLRKGQPAIEVVNIVEEFLAKDGATPEGRCMIAHQAPFDRRFIYALWAKHNKVFPATCWLDTKPAIKKYAQLHLGIEKPKLTLQASMDTLGLKKRGVAHTATSDTQNTYILYHFLQEQGFDLLPFIKRVPMEEEIENESEIE